MDQRSDETDDETDVLLDDGSEEGMVPCVPVCDGALLSAAAVLRIGRALLCARRSRSRDLWAPHRGLVSPCLH